jgi:hypothetical protein
MKTKITALVIVFFSLPAGEIRLSGDTSMRVLTTFPGGIRAILICM